MIKELYQLEKYEECNIYIYGTNKDSIDTMLVLSIRGIKIEGLKRSLNPKNIKSAFLFITAISKCKRIIKKFKPDVVIGVGGYVSAPVVYAAHKLVVKCCIHEQNSSFGVTNKFASNFADKIFVSFKSTINNIIDT